MGLAVLALQVVFVAALVVVARLAALAAAAHLALAVAHVLLGLLLVQLDQVVAHGFDVDDQAVAATAREVLAYDDCAAGVS